MKLWWRFRDWLCKPFGHVLYFPRGWKFWAVSWECGCSINIIGQRGSAPNFKACWNRMRRPAVDCPCWKTRTTFDPACACKGRGWVRR